MNVETNLGEGRELLWGERKIEHKVRTHDTFE